MPWAERAHRRVRSAFGGGGPGTAGHGHHRRTSSQSYASDEFVAAVVGGVVIPPGNSGGSSKEGEGAGGGEDVDDEEAEASFRPVQYRLEAVRVASKQGWCSRLLTCGGMLPFFGHHHKSAGIVGHHNQSFAMALHWMFRVNFVFLFGVMCVMFFAWVIFFAGWIAAAGAIDAECVRIGGVPYGSAGTPFADAVRWNRRILCVILLAKKNYDNLTPLHRSSYHFLIQFALSWTTFSTVGYGSTYPALGYENDSPTNCFFINFICSLESLLGVLYSGFCGAILFGKVLRIQSQAQVIFSDPILIRYGEGLAEESMSTEDDHHAKTPCPVLEFRIVNRLYNEAGCVRPFVERASPVVLVLICFLTSCQSFFPRFRGEIMDATLNVVANVDADDADPTLRRVLEGDQAGNYPDSVGTDTASDSGSMHDSTRSIDSARLKSSILSLITPFAATLKKDHQTVDEDPSARLVTKHIFSKMLIEASDHPFFKRVWLARHVLDEHSPILKPKVRRLIRRNGGGWPDRLNNYQSVRDSLRFNQILVSLNGVSNVSASDVYAQKIYDFV